MVAVDPVPESVALIETGLTADPPWLSRRRRHAALAVGVNGPLACTVFVHRYNSGQLQRRAQIFTRSDGVWRSVRGEQRSPVDDDPLSDRPSTEALGGVLIKIDRDAVQTNADRVIPWPRRYAQYALLRAAREVSSVIVGRRRLIVPRHGHVIVVWNSRRAPRPVAYDIHDVALGSLVVPHRPDPPSAARLKQRWAGVRPTSMVVVDD